MAEYLKRSWAEIDLDALAYNVAQVRGQLRQGCRLMGVVKADAYGHGEARVARKLMQCGVDWFGVSNVEEALLLRRQGLELPVLIFGTTPTELAKTLAEAHITQAVYSVEYAQALQNAAAAAKVHLDVHIKLDTGMTRLGFLCDEANLEQAMDEVQLACRQPNLHATGVFTHFASADDFLGDAVPYTREQFRRFTQAISALEDRGITFQLHHCANSAAMLNYPDMHLDMVRPGIVLYGQSPSDQCEGRISLKPVMALKSVIASVKRVPAGTPVSYGRIYATPRDSIIASVPIGYADGYRRNLSNRARMLVNGQYVPVVGRVCMDQLMLDVTDLPAVHRGDQVVIFGEQQGSRLTVDEMARLLDTVNYEITCLLSKRVPRVYLEGGREIAAENRSQ